MTEKNLMDNIIDGLKKEFNNNPPPQKCVINKIYNNNRVDVKLDDESFIKYVEVLGNASKGDEAVLCFLNGSLKEAIVISNNINLNDYYTKEEVNELITGGVVDLKDYVKKEDLINKTKYDIDLNLNFGASGMDDIITIDMDIVDHIVNKQIVVGGNNNGN